MSEDRWGYYGDKPPCEHLIALRKFLEDNEIKIYSEHEEDGWVNVRCKKCQRIYETTLRFNCGEIAATMMKKKIKIDPSTGSRFCPECGLAPIQPLVKTGFSFVCGYCGYKETAK